MTLRACSYQSVKSILERELDRLPLDAPTPERPSADHPNIRGAEYFDSIEGGAKAMVRTARTIEPNAANTKRYDAFYPQYRELYAALKKVRETK